MSPLSCIFTGMTSKNALRPAQSLNSRSRLTRPGGFRSTSTRKGQVAAAIRMRTRRWPLSRSIRGSQLVRLDRAKRPVVALCAAIAGACAFAAPTWAHGFGQRYDLPLPLSLYLFGTAAAVILSFVVVGLFARHSPGARGYPRIDLLAHPVDRWLAHPVLLALLKLITAGVFISTVTAGFCGNQDPYRNIAPTLVWIIWWVGLAIFSAFVGDLWALINPWRSLFDWADWAYRALSGRTSLALRLPYPEALGVWPAVGLLLAVSWTELVFPSPAVPANVAWLAFAYSLLSWGGMVLFGSEAWVEHGEVFAVFFGLFARLAPTEPSIDKQSGAGGLALRPFAAGLLADTRTSASMVAFVLL